MPRSSRSPKPRSGSLPLLGLLFTGCFSGLADPAGTEDGSHRDGDASAPSTGATDEGVATGSATGGDTGAGTTGTGAGEDRGSGGTGSADDAGSGGSSAGTDTDTTPGANDDPLIPRDDVFVLSPGERERFTLPPSWELSFGGGFEQWPLQFAWEAFDQGTTVLSPLDPDAGPAGWRELDGGGSQNHALLWYGVGVLGYAFGDDIENFELAAQYSIRTLELDQIQGHMRHESLGGYAGFWEGGIAAMALAGHYAPEGSTSGPELLAAARRWWSEHIAVLRALSMPDGQVMLLGARTPGEPGTEDSWASLSAAVNLQLVDPRPHGELHPTLRNLVTADGQPGPGSGGVPVQWYRPRHVAERWLVLRAVQSGAIVNPPDAQAPPKVVHEVFRWSSGDETRIGIPSVYGLKPSRWQMVWAPGQVVTVEIGDGKDVTGGRGPHPAPGMVLPADAVRILGP